MEGGQRTKGDQAQGRVSWPEGCFSEWPRRGHNHQVPAGFGGVAPTRHRGVWVGGAAGETHLTHRPSVKPSATSVTSVHRGSPSALGAEPCRHIGERQCPETGKAKSLGLPACARSAVLPASRKRGKSSEKGREPGPHHWLPSPCCFHSNQPGESRC